MQDRTTGADPPEELIAGLLQSPSSSVSHWRRKIVALDPNIAVPALTLAMGRCASWRDYQRLAFTLRRLDCDAARAPLAEAIRAGHRWAAVAIRALELAGTPAALALLHELLRETSRGTQRRIARALARRRYAPAIGTIADLVPTRSGHPDTWLVQALVLYGRPDRLIALVVADETRSPDDAAQVIMRLDELSLLRRVNARRALQRLAAQAPPPARGRAEAVFAAYDCRTTLLRPSERQQDATLLRPARGAPDGDTDRLVRPSASDEQDDVDRKPAGLVEVLAEAIRRLLD